MDYFMGIDLGSSSVKVMISDIYGKEQAFAAENYGIVSPKPGYSQQELHVWRRCTVDSVSEALRICGIQPGKIKAVGLSGQMHGLVMLDKSKQPLDDAVIHFDARSVAEVEYIINAKGIKQDIGSRLMNPIFTGFQLPSLLWYKNNRPDVYEKIDKIMSPKDYIRYMLTSEIGTEPTDASATLLYDFKEENWCYEILDRFEINKGILPRLGRPELVAGYVTKSAAELTGLAEGTPVVFGAADQAAQALGNGVIRKGTATSNIGTAGQIFTTVSEPVFNPDLNTNMFRHCPANTWYIMGAILNAGLAAKWFADNMIGEIDYEHMERMAQSIKPSRESVIFLPYLCGERTPIMNPVAKGGFFGIDINHSRDDMARAVMEGVVFALRDSLELVEKLGGGISSIIASGGGAISKLWLQMQADIFNREIKTTASAHQANLGASILAALGTDVYFSYEEACENMVSTGDNKASPVRENVELYGELFERYKELRNKHYPSDPGKGNRK